MVCISKSSVLLLPLILTFVRVADGGELQLRRRKREWLIPPPKLFENKEDYMRWDSIFKLQSDKEYTERVYYSLEGHGANLHPAGLFTVNPDSGLVRIHGTLDREETPSYKLYGVAKYSNGKRAERDVMVTVIVLDQNDCPPVFSMSQTGSVYESSAAGTVVMRVNATDADEPGTLHTQIRFSIVQTSSSDRMFYMNSQTGEIVVSQNTLDRETQETFTLTVLGADMNGAPGGNSASAEVVITLLDINDNVPTLEYESYEGSVMENTINVEVLRIRALDLDLMFSDNWLAVFSIVSGNEAGYFSISTDAKTNEGVLVIIKALDYEELKVLNLAVSVSNKAEYNFGSSGGGGAAGGGGGIPGQGKTYQIKINVMNEREGPRFQPPVKVVTISEDPTADILNKVVINYAAIDSDTLQIATNVRYAKVHDVGNWLIIDEKTGDIRLNKVPDRESSLLINGTYYAKIICITNEVNSKTATGTIAIQVEDFNDNCPVLISSAQTMCWGDNAVVVTAQDGDPFPNGEPFTFRVVQTNAKEKWAMEHLNDTAAILRDHAHLWPGTHRVAVEIRDMHGKACAGAQWLDVTVCTCDEAKTACLAPRASRSVSLGAWGVLLLLLGLLLLLLLPLLLLFCLCGGPAAMGNFKAIPFDTREHLIAYHTEGQGEDKEVPMLQVPVEIDHGITQVVDTSKFGGGRGQMELGAAGGGACGAVSGGGGGGFTSFSTSERYGFHGFHGGREEVDYAGVAAGGGGGAAAGRENVFLGFGTGAYDGIALSEAFLNEYYSSKASHAAGQAREDDAALVYGYEGRGSPAGSVGCCSLLGADDDLGFLDDLGPKFKTLAEICRGGGSGLEAEVTAVVSGVTVSPPPPRPTAAATAVHHRETIGDATLASSLSSSSTLFRETTLAQRASAAAAGVRLRHQEGLAVAGGMAVAGGGAALLVQQPAAVYYSAQPVYLVEQQPPQVVLLERRVAGVGGGAQHVVAAGQGLVQVGGAYASQVGGAYASQVGGAYGSPQEGILLVGAGGGGGARVVAGGGGHTLMGGGGCVVASAQAAGVSSGSRQVLLVEGGGPGEVRGQGGGAASLSHALQAASLGTGGEDLGTRASSSPGAGGGHRVVVQHKKISVTERSVESSSVA